MDKPTTENSQDDLMPQLEKVGLSEKVSHLRQKLGQKAKQEPKFRFYSLYGHICSSHVLFDAWKLVRANKGSPGVDRMTFEMIEQADGGEYKFLGDIRESLSSRTYKPEPVKRVYVPKPDGRLRPLGIPCIIDRVVQMAVLLTIEPIFEADFENCSYGFRPKRSAHQALEEIRSHLKSGYRAVYDADLKGYFDSIPHDKLMACLEMRIVDRKVLKLIRMWLKSPVVEPPVEKNNGKKGKYSKVKGKLKVSRSSKGTPQGGVISPLLANIYLHWFDKIFHRRNGPAFWAGAKLVRYADDFVVMARYQGTRLTKFIELKLEDWMSLTINREKTRIVDLREDGAGLDFLGYTFRYDEDLKGRGYKYLNVTPSKKALSKEREKLRQLTCTSRCFMPLPDLIKDLNRHLKGWRNYFSYGYPRMAFRHVNYYTRLRLYRHLHRRSQRPFKPPEGVSFYGQFKRMGLIYL